MSDRGDRIHLEAPWIIEAAGELLRSLRAVWYGKPDQLYVTSRRKSTGGAGRATIVASMRSGASYGRSFSGMVTTGATPASTILVARHAVCTGPWYRAVTRDMNDVGVLASAEGTAPSCWLQGRRCPEKVLP